MGIFKVMVHFTAKLKLNLRYHSSDVQNKLLTQSNTCLIPLIIIITLYKEINKGFFFYFRSVEIKNNPCFNIIADFYLFIFTHIFKFHCSKINLILII